MASPDQIKPDIKPGITVEFKDKYGETCRGQVRDVHRIKRIGQLVNVMVVNSIGGYEYVSPERFKVIIPTKKR